MIDWAAIEAEYKQIVDRSHTEQQWQPNRNRSPNRS